MEGKPVALVGLVTALLLLVVAVHTAFAQKASVPKPQDKTALIQSQVRQLLALMDIDKDGKISKQEWIRFMEAEFDRLDKDHDGSLDATDLAEFRVLVTGRPFAAAGK
jgi:hypothetical protein